MRVVTAPILGRSARVRRSGRSVRGGGHAGCAPCTGARSCGGCVQRYMTMSLLHSVNACVILLEYWITYMLDNVSMITLKYIIIIVLSDELMNQS